MPDKPQDGWINSKPQRNAVLVTAGVVLLMLFSIYQLGRGTDEEKTTPSIVVTPTTTVIDHSPRIENASVVITCPYGVGDIAASTTLDGVNVDVYRMSPHQVSVTVSSRDESVDDLKYLNDLGSFDHGFCNEDQG